MEPKNGKISTWRMSDGNLVNIEQYNSLIDTVDLAREYARLGYPDRYAVFAPVRVIPGKNKPTLENGIFLSLILRPSLFASQALFLRIISVLSLLETLEEHSSEKMGIGWVSDIYCRGKKIGETTVEGKLDDYSAYEYLIVTFRIALDSKRFAPKLTDLVSLVFDGEEVTLSSLYAKLLLERFFRLYASMQTPQKFMDFYRDKFVFRGRRVTCHFPEEGTKRMKILGVEKKDGTLLVEDRAGRVRNIANRSYVTYPKRIHM